VLRDLAEGDIAFGHGIAKGYGQCQEKQVLAAWESLLKAQFPEQADPVRDALNSLRKLAKQDLPACEEPFKDVKNVELKPLDITPAINGFLNPYHFIPFSKPNTTSWTTPEKLQSERGHDRYQGLSGRITCKLTTKTPLFIGATRKEAEGNHPTEVFGYTFQDKLAIPATSLRGMISSLFESISASNLRQLTRERYMVRDQKRKKRPVEVVALLKQFDNNLLPLGFPEREEKCFSPVELLFGVIEDQQSDSKRDANTPALALAGRVVIRIGVADADIKTEKAVTLKELSSPKPPSPALYFKPIKGDDYVSKANLADSSSKYTLRGRKTYLHAWREEGRVVKLNDQGLRDDQQGREPWASKYHGKPDSGHKRRVKVEPIAAGQSFSFHIDFHNLSERELQQLCATLQPDPAFEHRLGMGKPLGLGSVKLQIRAIQLINRTNRYASDALTADRSHQALSTEEIVSLTAAGMQTAPSDVRRALQLLGNPAAIAAPVHYPQVEGGMLEEKHFEWFKANDTASGNNKQSLKAISYSSDRLPLLTRKPKAKNSNNHQPNNNWNQKRR
jgi:CRISPR/Cas system CSM-associated protein Csm3 (group 7 of RAMP superfamily)